MLRATLRERAAGRLPPHHSHLIDRPACVPHPKVGKISAEVAGDACAIHESAHGKRKGVG